MNSFAYLFERFPSFVQTFVYREAFEMVRQGMDPWLVSLRRPDDPATLAETPSGDVFYAPEEKALRAEVDALRAERRLPGKAHRIIPKRRKEPDSQRMFEAVWLAPRLRERGVRHVHAHFAGLAARTAWWLRELYGFSYSLTGHANDLFCPAQVPVTMEALLRGARFVVTETDYARHWLEKRYACARGKTFRVFNGIALEGFPSRAPALSPPLIVCVGRFVEKKGYSVLIEACRLLREQGIPFACALVGEGPLEPTIREQIAVAGLEDAVRLLGPRAQPEVRQLLSTASIFALACVPDAEGGSDNLPTVIMEAMACGLPVVSTRVAGVPEMIVHGEEGLLTAPNDAPAFAAALAQLLADPAMAERFRTASRASATKFDLRATTRELKHLLVQRAGVRPPQEAANSDPTLRVPTWWERVLPGFLRG